MIGLNSGENIQETKIILHMSYITKELSSLQEKHRLFLASGDMVLQSKWAKIGHKGL